MDAVGSYNHATIVNTSPYIAQCGTVSGRSFSISEFYFGYRIPYSVVKLFNFFHVQILTKVLANIRHALHMVDGFLVTSIKTFGLTVIALWCILFETKRSYKIMLPVNR